MKKLAWTKPTKEDIAAYVARLNTRSNWMGNLIPVDPTRDLGPKGFDEVPPLTRYELAQRAKSDAAHLAAFPPVDEKNKPIFIGTMEEYDELAMNEAVEFNPHAAISEALDRAAAAGEAKRRKDTPVYSGVLNYFPLALKAVARVSKAGNDQHNPGQPLHWARGKSTDHLDCIARHLLEAGTIDTDGQSHLAKVAWRALAALQEEEENATLDT